MILAPATLEVAEALASAHAEGFDKAWSAADIADLLVSPGVYGFLASGKAPAGMILCRVAADDAEVLTLAVAPSARRRGIGLALLEAAAQSGQAAGATAMFLEVAVDNLAAVALYERAGFRRIALRQGYYDRGAQLPLDALVMRLDLPVAQA